VVFIHASAPFDLLPSFCFRLDYNRNFSPPDIQRAVFRVQLRLACHTQLPLFVHEREANDDMLKILAEFPSRPPTVVHCFTGSRSELTKLLDAGCYIGLTGFVAMQQRGADVRSFVTAIPLDRLMIESDGPYMAPDMVDAFATLVLPPDEASSSSSSSSSLSSAAVSLLDDARTLAKLFKKSGRNEPCCLPLIAAVLAEVHFGRTNTHMNPRTPTVWITPLFMHVCGC
jgi:Tat protein secretion system quality control protein TatD with DNase activity